MKSGKKASANPSDSVHSPAWCLCLGEKQPSWSGLGDKLNKRWTPSLILLYVLPLLLWVKLECDQEMPDISFIPHYHSKLEAVCTDVLGVKMSPGRRWEMALHTRDKLQSFLV